MSEKKVAELIDDRRRKLHLTYEELGEKCGVGKSMCRKWCIGETENMRIDNLKKIAVALNVNELYLLGYDVSEERNIFFLEGKDVLWKVGKEYNLMPNELDFIWSFVTNKSVREKVMAIYQISRM